MPTTKPLMIDNVDLDDEREMDEFDRQVIAVGMERVQSEIERLRSRGLLDAQGRLVVKELPADMVATRCRRVHRHLPQRIRTKEW